MEIIQLTSYTEFEKLNIAQKYLIPRQKEGMRSGRRAGGVYGECRAHRDPPLHA